MLSNLSGSRVSRKAAKSAKGERRRTWFSAGAHFAGARGDPDPDDEDPRLPYSRSTRTTARSFTRIRNPVNGGR